MGILPSCSYVSTTVWVHYMDTNKMHGKKARQEPHKNAMCYFEQILEATPHKTAAVWSLTSHLTNHPSKTNKTWETLLEKQKWTHEQHWPPTHGCASDDQPAKIYIHQLCAGTGCWLEDLSRVMDDQNRW